jgi:hypothetical protein
MSSDSTGEIYVVGKSDGSAVDTMALAANGTGSASPSASSKAAASAPGGGLAEPSWGLLAGAVLVLSYFAVGYGIALL